MLASVNPSSTVTVAPMAKPPKVPTPAVAETASSWVMLLANTFTSPSARIALLATKALTVAPDTLTVKLKPTPATPPAPIEPAIRLVRLAPSAKTDTSLALTVELRTRACVLPWSKATLPLPATPREPPTPAPAAIWATVASETALTVALPWAFTVALSITSAVVLRLISSEPTAPATPVAKPPATVAAVLAISAWSAANTRASCAASAPDAELICALST